MAKELIFNFPSPNRDSLKVYGYRFKGEDKKPSVAIVSGLRGDEILQLYVASQLVNFLNEKVKNNINFIKGEILIIPSVNTFGFNIEKRYWPLDNTDISRMFPGYEKGETTQRIAALLFEKIQGFDFGIKLTSGVRSAEYIPHVKVFDMENSDIEKGKDFGFRYVHKVEPKPYDTASLTYNWHIWNTKAFSIYGGKTNHINFRYVEEIKNGIIRFLSKNGIINFKINELFCSQIINDKNLLNIKTPEAGIFHPFKKIGDFATKGEPLFKIEDPLSGETRAEIESPVDGIVFQMHSYPMIYQSTTAFKIETG